MKKFKNLAKKTAAWAVLLSMAFSEVTNAFASTQTASANNEEALKSELYVDSSYAAEHPNGVFTFYESKIVANEGDGTAEIKVVRKGGSKGKATVKFKAVDITSVYGTDYTISVGNSLFSKVLDANPNAEHLIDRYLNEDSYNTSPEDKILSDAAAQIIEENPDVTSDNGIEIATEIVSEETTAEETTVENGVEETTVISKSENDEDAETTTETTLENNMSVNMGGQNALMNAAAAYTGVKIQKPNWKENLTSDNTSDENQEAIQKEVRRQALEKEDALEGVDYVLNFDEGEVEKTLIVNINDDDIYKNETSFFIFLTDCEGAEIDEVNSGYVVIEDNDVVEKTKYAISDNLYEVGPDAKEAEIKVVRTSGINYLDAIDVYTKDDTAKAGQDYAESATRLLFPGGVTERTFKVPLSQGRKVGTDFYVMLNNEDGNVDSKSATAKVKFVDNTANNSNDENGISLLSSSNSSLKSETIEINKTAQVNSKNGSNYVTVPINRPLVDHIDVEYETKGGTKVCKGWDYGGNATLEVKGHRMILGYGMSGIAKLTGHGYYDGYEKNNGYIDNLVLGVYTSGKNSFASITVKKATIYYSNFKVNIDNTLGENNTYTPRVWSAVNGAYLYTDKNGNAVVADKSEKIGNHTMYYNFRNTNNTEKLQIAKLSLDSQDDSTSKTVSYGDTISFKNNYLNNWNSESAYLDHYIIKSGSTEKEIPASGYITIDNNFLANYGSFLQYDSSGTKVTITPVYKPKTAFVQIKNNDEGSVVGSENGNDIFKVKVKDYLAVQSVSNAGHYVSNISLESNTLKNNSEYSDLEWNDKTPDNINISGYNYGATSSETINKDTKKDGYEFADGDITKATFPINNQLTTVYSLPGDTNLKVAVHPKQKANADKGAVIYTGSDGKVITTDENYTLDVKNAEINKNYIFKGIVNKTTDGSVKFEDSSKNKADIKVQLINHKEYDLGDVLKEELTNGVKTDKNGNFDFDDFYKLDTSKEYEFTVKLDYNGKSCSDIITVKNGKITKKIVFTIAKDGNITSSKEDVDFSDYIFYWKDGTFSNPDGSRNAEQTAKAKSYGIDPDLSFAGSAYSHIFKYYDSMVYYTMIKKDEGQYQNPGKFSGYVYYKKRELFSDNSTQEPIAGCAVYVGDKYLLTDNDGHFEYKFDKGYGFFDVFSLIINYNNRNYSSKISADQEKSYTIDAEEVVSYSNPILLRDGDVIGYDSGNFDNGDRNYTIKIQVNSKDAGVVPYKTYFTAYNNGVPVGTNAVPIVNGFATYEFNPTKYMSDNDTTVKRLDEDTIFKVTTEDANHNKYTEMETGLKLEKYVGSRGISGSIVPNGGSVNLLGSFVAGFGANAIADEKNDKMQAYDLSPDDISFINTDLTAGKVDTKLAGNVKFADEKEKYKAGIKVELINDKKYNLSDAVKNDVANGVVTDEEGNFYFNNFGTLDKDVDYEFTLKFTYGNFYKTCKINVKNGKLVQQTNFVVTNSGITSSQENIEKKVVDASCKYMTLNLGFTFNGEGSSESTPEDKVPTGGYAIPKAMKNAFDNNNVLNKLEKLKKSINKAKDARTKKESRGFANKSTFDFAVAVNCKLGWVKTKEGYKMSDVTIMESVEAKVNFDMVYQTPVFIQILGEVSLGVNLDATQIKVWPLADGNVVDTGKLELGNMFDDDDDETPFMNGGSYWYTDTNFSVLLSLYAGVGIFGISAKIGGDAVYSLEHIFYKNSNTGKSYSDMATNQIVLTAKVKITVIVFSVKYEFAKVKFDFNNIGKNKADTNLMLGSLNSMDMGGQDVLLKDANTMFGTEDLSYLDGREGWTGNSPMLLRSLNGKNSTLYENQIMDKVYENSYPQIENIGNEKYLLVYCDRIAGSKDKTGIYYSVFDGTWSEPKLISSPENGSTEPYLINTNDKAYVAWTDVKSVDSDNVAKSLNSTDIRMSVFDKNTLTFGDALDVTHDTDADEYSDNTPVLSQTTKNGKDLIMVYYLKSYYEQNNALVGDIINPYTIAACRIYDVNSGKFVDDYSELEKENISTYSMYNNTDDFQDGWYGQKFLDVSPNAYISQASVLNDEGNWTSEPQLYSNNAQKYGRIISADSCQHNGKNVFAYVLDEDGNLATSEDEQVYIKLYDASTDTFTDAMKVSDSEGQCSSPKLVQLKDKTYLLWTESDGIKAIDIGNVVDNCIKEETVDGKTVSIIDKSENGNYVAPINMISAGDNTVITKFSVESDGDNTAYISWTQNETKLKDGIEEGTEDAEKAENRIVEKQIYIARYTADNDKLSVPVKMTDEVGANYGDVTFDVTDDDVVKAVTTKSMSDVIEVKDSKNGNTAEYAGENMEERSLVELNFNVADDINIKDIDLTKVIYGYTPTANVKIKNEGFVDGNGLKVEAYVNDEKVGEVTNINLAANEETTVYIDLPELTEKKDYKVDIKLVNGNGKVIDEDSATEPVDSKISVSVDDYKLISRDEATMSYTIKNEGNFPESGLVAVLQDTVDGSTSKTIDIGDLAPKEEKTGTIQFNVPKDDYHEIEGLDEDYDYGYLDYANFVLSVGNASDVFGFIRYASDSQIKKFGKTSKIITSVGDNITVKTGDIVDMNLSVDNEDTSGIKYKVVSSNNDVVSTNDLGILRGIGEGNCTVTVYAMPFDDEVVLTGENEEYTEDAWETVPEKYVVSKTFNVTVGNNATSSKGNGDDTIDTGDFSKASGEKSNTTTTVTTESTTETTTNDTVVTETTTEATTEFAPVINPFKDIVGKWYENTIAELYNKGIVSGVSKDEFAPENNVKRGDFVMLIMNSLGDKFDEITSDEDTTVDEFADVSADSYYHDSIIKARKLGIAYGAENNNFNADDSITREEMCAFTARALRKIDELDESQKDNEFTDKADISAYAVKDINDLYAVGIVKGYENNEIRPKAYTKRAEAAQVVYNIINK